MVAAGVVDDTNIGHKQALLLLVAGGLVETRTLGALHGSLVVCRFATVSVMQLALLLQAQQKCQQDLSIGAYCIQDH